MDQNTKISIVIPTYNEKENISSLVEAINAVLERNEIKGEIIVVDDNSPDGTGLVAEELKEKHDNLKVVKRKGESGLASAVLHGFGVANSQVLCVMDADMSHPVEKIPAMIKPILEGKCDATVGSRYIRGGRCENWPLFRRIRSKGAKLFARGVTKLSDPTSGFMAVRAEKLQGIAFDAIGWKVVLEIIVKTNARYLEVPIAFSERAGGKSKLDSKAQSDYLRHLWRLYCFKYPSFFKFVQFCLVGLSGLLVDCAVLVCVVELFSFDPRVAAILAFSAAVSWNYTFNRVWTFKASPNTKVISSYVAFVVVCLIGLGTRVGIMHVLIAYGGMDKGRWYILASILGIFGATVINFCGSKQIVFPERYSYKTQA